MAADQPGTEGRKRETWQDWQAPDAPEPTWLQTRAELLETLEARRVDPPVTESDLRYWEYRGLLPAPIRQWHHGATRAVYPLWVTELVADLRFLQAVGHPLAQIGPALRAEATRLSRIPDKAEHVAAIIEQTVRGKHNPFHRYPLPPAIERIAQLLLVTLAEQHRRDGAKITSAGIVFLNDELSDDDQAVAAYEFSVPEYNSDAVAEIKREFAHPTDSQTPTN